MDTEIGSCTYASVTGTYSSVFLLVFQVWWEMKRKKSKIIELKTLRFLRLSCCLHFKIEKSLLCSEIRYDFNYFDFRLFFHNRFFFQYFFFLFLKRLKTHISIVLKKINKKKGRKKINKKKGNEKKENKNNKNKNAKRKQKEK